MRQWIWGRKAFVPLVLAAAVLSWGCANHSSGSSSSSGGGGGSGSSGGVTVSAAALTAVPAESVAGKSFSFNGATLSFASDGKSGTATSEGSTLTFTYDGDVLTASGDGGSFYLKLVSGSYYLLDINRVVPENGAGSGFWGKWVWEKGTPSNFYDYYNLIQPNKFQNPPQEASGTYSTFTMKDGIFTFDDKDDPAIYDGTYLYPVCYLLTLV